MKNEDVKIERQALSISSKLNVYKPCEIKTKYIDLLDKVSKSMLQYILSKKFMKGADMKAVLCLFDTLFLSLSIIKENGIYVLTKEITKYIDTLDFSLRIIYYNIWNPKTSIMKTRKSNSKWVVK